MDTPAPDNTGSPDGISHPHTSGNLPVTLPVSMNEDGTFIEETIDLSTLSLTKPGGLRDVVRRYKTIQITGSKADLTQRLRDLSLARERWRNEFQPGARRSHKGSTTSRKSQLKQSNIRRQEMFTHPSAGPSSQPLLAARPVAETAKLRDFSQQIMARIRLEAQRPSSFEPLPPPPSSDPGPVQHAALIAHEQIPRVAHLVATQVVNELVPRLMQQLVPTFQGLPPAISASSQPQGTSAPLVSLARTSGQSSVALPNASAAVTHPAPPSRRRTIRIHGTDLSFAYGDVPNPPALRLVGDISHMAAHWGDDLAEWNTVEHSAALRVCDTPVPVRLWKDVYSGWTGTSDRRWELLKGPWIDLRFLVQCFRKSGSVDAFWAQFTIDGKRLPITAVKKRLQQARIETDKRIAQFAHEYCNEHGENLGELVGYRKTDKFIIPTRPHVIARKWRQLGRPLPNDVDMDIDDDDEIEG